MGQFFEYEMTVDSRDVDGWGRCRPSAVLGYLQEAATLAAEDGGFGREDPGVPRFLDAGPDLVPSGPPPAVGGEGDGAHLAPGQ